MRCQYCHNPETWTMDVGNGVGVGEFTAEEAFKKAVRYKPYWKDNGGITVSGGEPLLQIDFVIELFTLAKAQGIHTRWIPVEILFQMRRSLWKSLIVLWK